MANRVVLLARFRWSAIPDPVAALHAALSDGLASAASTAGGRAIDASTLAVHRAVDADEGFAYLDRVEPEALAVVEQRLHAALPDAALARLEPLLELVGSDPHAAASWHYVVETDVLPQMEAQFNDWYDQEHLPGLAAVPGVVAAARYRDRKGSPRYHASYELARLEAFGSPPWLAVRATEWSARVRPAFRNTKRTMFQRIA